MAVSTQLAGECPAAVLRLMFALHHSVLASMLIARYTDPYSLC